MKRGWIKVILGLLVLALAAGCSKDSDNGTGPGDTMPAFDTPDLPTPAALTNNSGDPEVAYALNLVGMVNAISTWDQNLEPPGKVLGKILADDTWEESWEAEGVTYTLRVQETSTQFIWQLILDGEVEPGVVVSDFTFIYAIQMKDGSEGSFTIYNPEDESVFMSWDWTADETGTYVEFSVGDEFYEIHAQYNADGSGWLEEYYEGVIGFKIVWTAAGTGEWWEYTNGVQSDHGTFP